MTNTREQITKDVMGLADDFLERLCELDPLLASEEGFSEYDGKIGDLSPARAEKLADLAKSTRFLIKNCEIKTFDQQLCADVLDDYCQDMIDEFETDDWIRTLNILENPLDAIHMTCYNADINDEKALAKRNEKIDKIPNALATFKDTIMYGLDKNALPRRTQIAHMAHNCALFANDPIFLETKARNAFLRFGSFLMDEIIPKTDEQDAVGPEIYARSAKRHLGKEIDLVETYKWGWHEIHSIFDEISKVINDIKPGASYRETIEFLDADEARIAKSPQELREFLQNLLDDSVTQLNGKHFDIDPRMLKIEACILDESPSSAMFYSSPSEDFSRPGRTYYPINDKKVFPLWEEVTTCYHEGLPGHHLHVGSIKCLGDHLSTFQKTLAFNAGESEGWALYAERLMVELGYSSDPAYIFGMLNASLFRATRVVMDIGLHCQFEIPENAPKIYPRGQQWNPNLAMSLLENVIGMNPTYARDEVYRYLGWIGQAVCYKIGEQTIRDIRESERKKLGADFSLKDFHTRLLGYGHVGLGRLEKLFQKQP